MFPIPARDGLPPLKPSKRCSGVIGCWNRRCMPNDRPRATERRTGHGRYRKARTVAESCLRARNRCGGRRFGVGGRQPADDPRITVAAIVPAEPASQVPLQIQVGPPNALPKKSFIRLRGLPASVSLTEGHAIAPGSWAVPLFGLPSLKRWTARPSPRAAQRWRWPPLR